MRIFFTALAMLGMSVFAQPLQLLQDSCLPRSTSRPSSIKNTIGTPSPSTYVQTIDLPVRYQFDHNAGYCGETTLIAAGLRYGQYVSQWTVRQLCDPSDPDVQTDNQVLLGVNAASVADSLHLNHVSWDNVDTTGFFKWTKAYALNGYPVIIGVFMNYCTFYNECSPTAGDSTYDHIVIVFGIGSNYALTPPSLPPVLGDIPFYNDDVLVFSDNGLYGSGSDAFPNPPPYQGIRYIWALPFGPEVPSGQNPNSLSSFQANRAQANAASAHAYSIPSETYCNENSIATYAMAILGVKDTNSDTIPIRIHIEPINTNLSYSNVFITVPYTQDAFFYEWPVMAHGQTTEPNPNLGVVGVDPGAIGPQLITLTVTVTIPDQTKAYNLYYYNDLTNVPDSDFNAAYTDNPAIATKTVIPASSGSTYVTNPTIYSNQVAVFRAVLTTAP